MGVSRKPERAAPYVTRAALRCTTALEAQLTLVVEGMKAEVAERGMISEKSAGDLHDLRVRAEGYLKGLPGRVPMASSTRQPM